MPIKDENVQEMRVIATPVRQQVAEAIRSAIVSSRFEPGQRLVERDLCELLGVSRVSVREALRQLEAEGFIDTIPHRGPVVVQLTAKDVRNLYDVLSVLEAQGARLFTQNATDDEIEALDQSVKDISRVYKKGSLEDRLAAKMKFYQIMFAGARNPILESAFRTVYGRINIVLRMALTSSKNLDEVAKALQKLTVSVRKREADEAFERSRHLVENAAVETLRHLAMSSQPAGGPENSSMTRTARGSSKSVRIVAT